MEYCSVEEAFPDMGPSNPGCKDNTGSEKARKEERKKAKKCRGPPLTFLDLDPDRPAYQKGPEVPPLNAKTGLREHAPVDAPQAEGFDGGDDVPLGLTSQRQPNDAGQIARNTLPTIATVTELQSTKKSTPAYFGANFDGEGFQNQVKEQVIGQDESYRLYPDFMTAFKRAAGRDRASAGPWAAIPSIKNEWKPLTPSGARTSFFDELPAPGGRIPTSAGGDGDGESQKTMNKKLNELFARLDDLESRNGENTQTEILLFVMSGLFVLFSMDIISRQAARIRFIA